MWFESASSTRAADDPARLTLRELVATQGRRQRGPLAPGERFPTGVRPGRRRAQGLDLDSIGPYVPGDDPRWMDWRATARAGRAQMKRFVAESHLARMVIVDLRAHMYFGTGARPMAKTAAHLAARLCWEAVNLQEPVGLLLVPTATMLRPRRGRTYALRLLAALADAYEQLAAERREAHNRVLANALDDAARHLARGDEICLLSDFGGPLDTVDRVARGMAGARALHAVIIEDVIQAHVPPPGRYPLKLPGASIAQVADLSKSVAQRHLEMTTAARRELRRALMQAGWRVRASDGPGQMASEDPR